MKLTDRIAELRGQPQLSLKEEQLLTWLEDLARYSMSAGEADQRMAESRHVRQALGFDPDAEDVAPCDLVEKINALRSQSSEWLEAFHKAVSIGARYEERIAELEARTVRLPDAEKWRPVKEVVGQYSYRALVIKSLAAAGIKCEVKGE